MRASLERRIGVLEAMHGVAVDPLFVVRTIVTPGQPFGPATAASFSGVRLMRCNDESEATFMERVRLDVLARHPEELGRPRVIVDDSDEGSSSRKPEKT